jgi:hypothetical protein
MATKTPAKGKKPAAPKAGAAKKAGKAAAKPPVDEDGEPHEGDEDDEDEDEELEAAPKAAAKKPASPAGKAATSGEPAAVVPARRLTPEAKAKVNEMVKKGMPLGEALKAAASWETFVAPVKEEPAKLVQGKSFEGGRRPRRPRDQEGGGGGGGGGGLDMDGDEEPSVEAEE